MSARAFPPGATPDPRQDLRHDLRISPSILSADFAHLADEVAAVAPHVSVIHLDVMDGHYVPNITIGPAVVSSLRAATPVAFDTHLMVSDPDTYAPQFFELGSESVTFHVETTSDPAGLVERLHAQGAQVGVALKPRLDLDLVEDLLADIDMLLCMTVEPGFGGQAFMAQVLPKVAEAAAWRAANDASFRIQVDGGIDADTVASAVAAGADTLVAGSAVFGQEDRAEAIARLLAAAATGRSGDGA